MKHQMRTLACGVVLIAAIVTIACGGKQTMASKSAAAYDDAMKKGIPIETGEHGGHSAEPAGGTTTSAGTAAMPGMDHSAMPGMNRSQTDTKHNAAASGTHEMAGMDHAAMAGMNHAQMTGMKADARGRDTVRIAHSEMAGMDHSTMPAMKGSSSTTGSRTMPGMNMSASPGAAHESMAGMRHGATAAMPRGSQTAPITIPPLASNAAIARTQPSQTLRPDEFDAPAPTAVAEAAKGASATSPSMEGMTPAPPKAKPPSGPTHKGSGGAA